VKLARRHGIFATARALRLDYIRLKARVESAHRTSGVSSKRSQPASRRAAPPAFVELMAPRPGSGAECRVELEGLARPDADRVQGDRHSGTGGHEPGVVGWRGMAMLYDRYSGVVYSPVRRTLNDAEGAEEILQHIFSQLWRTASGFDLALRAFPTDGGSRMMSWTSLCALRWAGFWPVITAAQATTAAIATCSPTTR